MFNNFAAALKGKRQVVAISNSLFYSKTNMILPDERVIQIMDIKDTTSGYTRKIGSRKPYKNNRGGK